MGYKGEGKDLCKMGIRGYKREAEDGILDGDGACKSLAHTLPTGQFIVTLPNPPLWGQQAGDE